MTDIIIVGAGPAGMAAALYARRAEKSVLLLEKENFGGQISYSPKVENYPGFAQISGSEIADKLFGQISALDTEVEMEEVLSVCRGDGFFTVKTDRAERTAKAVIIATGSHYRRLGVAKEEELVGKGVSYCALCDGAFYKNKDVAVIGGGNTALQNAVLLADTCRRVTILQNLPTLTGEEKLQNILRSLPNVDIVCSVTVDALLGDESLTGVRVKNTETNALTEFAVDGIFVAIGQQPENEPFAEVAPLDKQGYLAVDESCTAPTPGVFVAGDCRAKTVRQVVTAMGDGACAAVAACRYLDTL